MNRGFIDQCERERLHLSGCIQPHGVMLVACQQNNICYVSENCVELLGFRPGILLSSTLEQFCELCKQQVLQPGLLPGKRDVFYAWTCLNETLFDLIVSRAPDGNLVLELLPVLKHKRLDRPAPELPECFQCEITLQNYQQSLVSWLCDVSGFERVMYYQFLPGGDGEVIAESCLASARGSFLGHRFPASDIPEIARKLYIMNPWRSVVNAHKDDAALLGKEERPDLSYTDLRSVSPVHKVYMQNMGKCSSLSFPVIHQGYLDALITCHDSRERRLSLEDLEALSDSVVRYTEIFSAYKQVEYRRVQENDQILIQSLSDLLPDKGLTTQWYRIAGLLCDHFNAQGAVCLYQNQILAFGLQPEVSWLQHIHQGFLNSAKTVLISDHASTLYDCDQIPAGEVAGVAGFRFNGKMPYCLYLLRDEYVHDVTWGGNPDKPLEQEGEIPVSPRQSFASWVEQQRGFSRPWPSGLHERLAMLRTLFP